jgi:CHAP domain
LEEQESLLVTNAYSQYLASLTDRVTTVKARLTAGVVAGTVGLGVVTAAAAAASVAPEAAPAAAPAQSRSHAQQQARPDAQQQARSHAEQARPDAQQQARPRVAQQARLDVKQQAAVSPALTTAAATINLAEKQVGITADSSGQTKFQGWYASTPDARLTAQRDGGRPQDYNGAEWCDMFVSWVGAHAGVKDMGRDAYTVAHAKWFQKVGRWGETPKPGAVVFYAWNGGGIEGIEHVGLVVKSNGDGSITTIEGNTTGDSVAKRVRSMAHVVGYGYPEYAKS